MIDQLVKLVADRLGVDSSMAEQGVGTLLGLLKGQASGTQALSQLFDKLPGAEALADQFMDGAPSSSGGGGLMGGLLSKASGMLGGNAGDMMEAMAAFQKTGLSMDQAKDMMPVVKDFMVENVGADTLKEVVGSVPALKNFLG